MAGELGLGTAKIAGTVAVSDAATVGAATAGALGTTYHSSNIIGTATGTNPVESYIYNGDTESFREDTDLLDNINMTSSAYGMIGAGSKPGEEAVENLGERYDWGGESGSTSLQDIANKAAQEYNAKYNPYERAISKGYTDVKKTANGGVSFQGSEYMYYHNGQEARKVIQATGNRNNDFKMANQAMRLLETPDGYVWHHLDDYNVEKNTITMELVMDEAHNASKPHSGGCAQYDSVNGPTYNKKRR